MIKIFGTNSMAHKIVDRWYEKKEQMTKEEFKTLNEAINSIANVANKWKNAFDIQSPSKFMRGEEEDQNGGD
jgi:uncharacterized protein YacL (UPF0231 family)